MSTATYTNDQKLAAVMVILDRVAELTDLTDGEREFVRHSVTATFTGTLDEGGRVALDTIGHRFVTTVDRIVRQAHAAASDVATKGRFEELRAAGKKPCLKCSATGRYINGGECWTCDGRGHR